MKPPLRVVVGAVLSWDRPSLSWLGVPSRPVLYERRRRPVTLELLECGHFGELHEWSPAGEMTPPRRRRCVRCARGEPVNLSRRWRSHRWAALEASRG